MNRDERWDRRGEGIHLWPGKDRIVAGRDGEKGGTWLGINGKGYCVAVTNIRITTKTSPVSMSRGLLVKGLLERESFNPQEWLCVIRAAGCSNFNLVFADAAVGSVFVYCSETDQIQAVSLQTPFTLANGAPGSNWPREARILEQFTTDEADYLQLLSDCREYGSGPVDYTSAPLRILPTANGTVDGQVRGTVSSSVITVDHSDTVNFTERSWNTESDPITMSFTIN